MEWLYPWTPLDAADACRLSEALSRELGPGHPLERRRFDVVARSLAADDILVSVEGEGPSIAVVHLSYGGRAKSPQWPRTRFYSSRDAWAASGMAADHDAYADEDA